MASNNYCRLETALDLTVKRADQKQDKNNRDLLGKIPIKGLTGMPLFGNLRNKKIVVVHLHVRQKLSKFEVIY